MPSIELSEEDKALCLQVAKQSISHGIQHGCALKINHHDYSSHLQQILASFVTLNKGNKLRGCIGTLKAYQPLIEDIAEHAYAAAFNDPRFPAVRHNELDRLSIDISVLSTPTPLSFDSEDDLINKIRPNIDGLILEYGFNKGTFLPSVWEDLPNKKDFLNHLKTKAGLASDWWNNDIKVSRYEAMKF